MKPSIKILAIVLSRFNSTRLPGKAMLRLGERYLFEHCVENVKKSEFISSVVVATSIEKSDDIIASTCMALDIEVYRGDLDDVLSRYYKAAKMNKADIIVYVGGDSPMMDIAKVDEAISLLIEENLDFVTNYEPPSFPNGQDINVIKFAALENIHEKAWLNFERTNIFSHITFNKSDFRVANVSSNTNFSEFQLAIDDPEDVSPIESIIQILENNKVEQFSFDKIMDLSNEDNELKSQLFIQKKIKKTSHALFSSKKIIEELLTEVSSIIDTELQKGVHDFKKLRYLGNILKNIDG